MVVVYVKVYKTNTENFYVAIFKRDYHFKVKNDMVEVYRNYKLLGEIKLLEIIKGRHLILKMDDIQTVI